MKKNFSIAEALSFSWQTTKNNFLFFLGVVIVFAVWGLLSSFLEGITLDPVFSFLIQIVVLIGSMILSMGFIRICLDFCAGEKPKFSRLFSMYPLIHFYFIASLLFFLMVGAGLLLLIVPGVILSLVFWFYGHALVDKRLGPIAALKEGARISRGARLEFFLFLFIFFLTNFALIVGWMFLIIPLLFLLGFFGIIIALVAPIIFFVFLFPFFGLIQAHIYVKLRDSELLPQ